MDNFILNIKTLFQDLCILHDNEKYIPVSKNILEIIDIFIIFYNKKYLSGGDITYRSNISYNKGIFENYQYGNEYMGNIDIFNFVILGAGPVGVYMAIILKMFMPKINIIIIETRVDDTLKRNLNREQVLSVDTCFRKMNELLLHFISLLPNGDIFNKDGYFTLLPFITIDLDTIQTNELELQLAVYAQSLNINIYHDNELIGDAYFDNLKSKYINNKTIAVFDATGGRLYKKKHNFIKIREDEITGLTQDAFLKTLRDRFDVLYGCLNHDDAFVVNDENLNCPYISIGETYIVSDWMEGKEIMYSCVFCIFIALIIYKDIYSIIGGKKYKIIKNIK